MSTKTQNASTRKRILSITVRRMIDDSPDSSYVGEYSNTAKTEYAIDRAHSEDCASVREDIKQAKQTLEHVQQTIGDLHNNILAQYNGTLANEKLDSEREALDSAYDEIGELIEDIDACDCGERGDMERGQYRYFNGPVENYKGLEPAEIRKYIRQDYDRMESLNRGDWCFIGIRAQAQVQTSSDVVQRTTSGGLWGIESDSGKDHFESIAREELAQLKTELIGLGFSRRAIATAIKNVQEEGD
jgi:hypothetical protein